MTKITKTTIRQRGIGVIQVIMILAVSALLIVAGAGTFKYVRETKVKTNMQELTELKAQGQLYATRHGGTYAGFTLEHACVQDFFAPSRCSGSGATTAATSIWGGPITSAPVNLTGANTGIKWSIGGYPSKACLKEVLDMWHLAARVDVGSTNLKTTTSQALLPSDETAVNTACDAASDNATVHYTFGTN